MVAIQVIADHCKKLKYKRKIVLVTNARGAIDADGLEEITKKVKGENIELVILYVKGTYSIGQVLIGAVDPISTTPIMVSRKRIRTPPRLPTKVSSSNSPKIVTGPLEQWCKPSRSLRYRE